MEFKTPSFQKNKKPIDNAFILYNNIKKRLQITLKFSATSMSSSPYRNRCIRNYKVTVWLLFEKFFHLTNFVMKNFNNVDKKSLVLLFAKKSNRKGFTALILNWFFFLGLFYVTGYSFIWLSGVWGIGLYLISSFLTGCALRGFDNLTHEASHYNVFRTKKWNDRLEFLFAYPVLKTVSDYRYHHNLHHKNYRHDKKNDPDTVQSIQWGVANALKSKNPIRVIISFYFIRPLILFYAWFNIKHSVVGHVTSKESIRGRLLFWAIIFIVITLMHAWMFFFLAYAIPYLFWLPFIRFITESSKHNNVNDDDDFGNSRSNIGVLHRLILHPHNDGYHQMHHYISCIPFYNLPKAYKYIKKHYAIGGSIIESFSPTETIKQTYINHEKN